MIKLANLSLFDIAATRAAALASGVADVLHTRFDFSGPFAQSGYTNPALAEPAKIAASNPRAAVRTILKGSPDEYGHYLGSQ